jgi:hypothetical protein
MDQTQMSHASGPAFAAWVALILAGFALLAFALDLF